MNCKCKVEQRRLTPGVFNLKQFLNGSETMIWELDNCVINQGTCDLKQYDAFLTLCVAGDIDEIMLTKRQTGDKLQLIWNVGDYATALQGYVKYQISFRSAQFDTLGVISDDPEVNGVYSLVDINTTGTDRVYRKAENGYSVKWDAETGCWVLYQADGVTVVDYQTTPNTEPHCGVWGTVAVGNNEAAAWISDEAIMFVSDSIAADQKITANFPTILRQFWAKVVKAAGVISVNKKTGEVNLSAADVGAAEIDHDHQIKDVAGLQSTLDGKAAVNHSHSVASQPDIKAALEQKSNVGHGHTIADTQGLQDALDGKAPTDHGHTISNVTGLPEKLQGFLPTAGGTMTGIITREVNGETNCEVVKAINTASGKEIWFGIGAGAINRGIYDKTSNCWMINFDADNNLRSNGKDITLGYPNYSAAVDLGSISTYTATQDGWVNLALSGRDHYGYGVFVNGIFVGGEGGEEMQTGLTLIPVKKGDVVKTTTSADGKTARTANYKFIPNR